MIQNNAIAKGFYWFNEPEYSANDNRLTLRTSPGTDFWQRTHYGFRRDTGHCLLTDCQGDFTVSVKTQYNPQAQYDQCGLIIRIDEDNWIKTSTEFETADHSRLGSVVTNLGYSDWATIDLHGGVNEMYYKIQKEGSDFSLFYSLEGSHWKQLRITHLLRDLDTLAVGIYACSPMESSFEATFESFSLEEV